VRTHGAYRQALRQAMLRARSLGARRVLLGMGATFEKTRFGAHSQLRVAFAQASDHYSSEVLAALGVVEALMTSLGDHSRVVLGGFSQGACLAAEYALRFPGRYGGLLLYTGGFIGPPGTVPPRMGSFDETPAYLGTSNPDAWVPADRVRETSDALTALGAVVTLDIFEGMDHLVNDDEIAAGRALLSGCV
jgi:predicted esterase